ncbi:MAG TPA: YggS family pyridoxal phosphate-dependent enzyme [Paracoccaceae bacterium]|nr:YggS family pyridoxal phosphate-dependent enzyme [Paracoccaceae bacterium]
MSLGEVKARIEAACRAAGRGPVSLVAVSKLQPLDRLVSVLEEGHRVFGENRVQEARAKWPALRERYPDVRLHLIGPLQSNKVRQALALFDTIQSLDRPKLARAIAEEVAAGAACPELFVQVNTGAEPQKAGVLPEAADGFIAACRGDFGLTIAGLMAIPPVEEDPAPHFRLLAEIAVRNGIAGLSMGMSGDYELAIAMGATHVRVGSAIFGERVRG